MKTVHDYLTRAIGEKLPRGMPLEASEVLYSVPRERRELVAKAIKTGEYHNKLYDRCKELGIWESSNDVLSDFLIMKHYGDMSSSSGNHAIDRLGYMFEDVWWIEQRLSGIVKTELNKHLGDGWWKQHVYPGLSKEARERLEKQTQGKLPTLSDVNMIDLVKITAKFWPYLRDRLGAYSSAKRQFENEFGKLNEIRNGLFHPAKGRVFDEDDFEHTRHVKECLLNNE